MVAGVTVTQTALVNTWHLLPCMARATLQDYLIAEGYNGATARGDVVTFESKFYCSQDGTKCADCSCSDLMNAVAE